MKKRRAARPFRCGCQAMATAPTETRNFTWALRHWLDGALGQNAVWSHMSSNLGPKAAHRALRDFECLLAAIVACARRPLKRGLSCCPRLQEDEAALGAVLRFSAMGDRRAAAAVAERLFYEGVEEIVELAATLGPVFAALPPPQSEAQGPANLPATPERRPTGVTLH